VCASPTRRGTKSKNNDASTPRSWGGTGSTKSGCALTAGSAQLADASARSVVNEGENFGRSFQGRMRAFALLLVNFSQAVRCRRQFFRRIQVNLSGTYIALPAL
jgi:hypothetical protein